MSLLADRTSTVRGTLSLHAGYRGLGSPRSALAFAPCCEAFPWALFITWSTWCFGLIPYGSHEALGTLPARTRLRTPYTAAASSREMEKPEGKGSLDRGAAAVSPQGSFSAPICKHLKTGVRPVSAGICPVTLLVSARSAPLLPPPLLLPASPTDLSESSCQGFAELTSLPAAWALTSGSYSPAGQRAIGPRT